MFHAQEVISRANATDALTDCTIMLYVMAERWPKARKYRGALERVKGSALDRIANDNPQQATDGGIIDSETRQALDSLDLDFGAIGVGALPQMINDIVSAPVLMWGNEDFDVEDVEEFIGLQASGEGAVPSFAVPTSMGFFSGEDNCGDEDIIDDDGLSWNKNRWDFFD